MSTILMYEQYPRKINEKRKRLLPRLREAKSKNERAWILLSIIRFFYKPSIIFCMWIMGIF